MNRHVIFLSVAVGLIALAGCQPARDDSDSLHKRLMEVAGINSQYGNYLEHFGPLLDATFGRRGVGAEDRLKLAGAFGRALENDVLLGQIEAGLNTGMSRETSNAALAWLESPLGMRFTEAEMEADDDIDGAVKSFMASGQEISAERMALIESLRGAMGGVETQIKTMATLLTTAELSIMYSERRATIPSPETLKADIREQVELQRQELQKSQFEQLLYLYRTFSDAELEQYLGFAQSSDGEDYHQAINESIDAALSECLAACREDVRQLFSSS